MALSTLVWKLASPYDAYVSHVARLEDALERLRYFSERALAYEAGLQSSVRLVPGQQGVYFVHSDATGAREFVYVRRGSAGSEAGCLPSSPALSCSA